MWTCEPRLLALACWLGLGRGFRWFYQSDRVRNGSRGDDLFDFICFGIFYYLELGNILGWGMEWMEWVLDGWGYEGYGEVGGFYLFLFFLYFYWIFQHS